MQAKSLLNQLIKQLEQGLPAESTHQTFGTRSPCHKASVAFKPAEEKPTWFLQSGKLKRGVRSNTRTFTEYFKVPSD